MLDHSQRQFDGPEILPKLGTDALGSFIITAIKVFCPFGCKNLSWLVFQVGTPESKAFSGLSGLNGT